MTTRKKTPTAPQPSATPPASDEASRNIWLAGLGAFAQAQAEGTKVFDALVKDGMVLQRKTQELAEAQLQATQRMAAEMTAQASAATGAGQWDRLGGIFERRVANALQHMGMPSAEALRNALARIDALQRELQARPADTRPAPRKRPAKGTGAASN